jgi:hypothetical protein
MEKDQIKSVLAVVSEVLRGLPVDDGDYEDDEETYEAAETSEMAYGYDGGKKRNNKKKLPPKKCTVPQLALYIIFTQCLTINNGACPDWDFCDGRNKKVVKAM